MTSPFNHAVDLESQPAYSDSPEFDQLNREITDGLFLLNTNLVTLQRLLRAVAANGKRQASTRAVELSEESRTRFKETGEKVKRLQAWGDVNASQRFTQQKLTGEFSTALTEFQQLQQRLADLEKKQLKIEQQTPVSAEAESQHNWQEQQQDIITADILNQSQVDSQMTLISERDEEIRNIEEGIQELNEIFVDLGQLVTQQGTIVDNIESNMYNIAGQTQSAATELTRAARYQSRSRSRQCCLLLILSIVLGVILLAVSIANRPSNMLTQMFI